jgi:hypothetical protein
MKVVVISKFSFLFTFTFNISFPNILIFMYSIPGDISYLVSKLGKIDGFEDLGTNLVKIIESKEVNDP